MKRRITPRARGVRPSICLTALEIENCNEFMHAEPGGQSSATPNERPMKRRITAKARGARPSISSRPQRKRPAHFPTVTVGFRSIIIFLTVCTRDRKPLLANDVTARLIVEIMASREFLASRPLCHYAGSHAFILRTKYVSTTTFEEVDRALEKSG